MGSTCAACIMLGDREFREVSDQCFVPARRISDMDSGHVHRQLLSPIPVLFCYWGPPEATAEFARIQNDFIVRHYAADRASLSPQRRSELRPERAMERLCQAEHAIRTTSGIYESSSASNSMF